MIKTPLYISLGSLMIALTVASQGMIPRISVSSAMILFGAGLISLAWAGKKWLL